MGDTETMSPLRLVLICLFLASTALLRYNTSPIPMNPYGADDASETIKRSMSQAVPMEEYVDTSLESLNVIAQALSRILIKRQSTQEQRVRAESISGITEMRTYHTGLQSYHLQHAPFLAMVRLLDLLPQAPRSPPQRASITLLEMKKL